MPVAGLHHVLLTVRDLRRSTDFYEAVLRLRKIREIPDDGTAGAKTLFALPDGGYFGLVQHGGGDGSNFDALRTGLDHVSFTVPPTNCRTGRTDYMKRAYRTLTPRHPRSENR